MQAQQWVCVCLCVWCYHLRRNQQFNYLFLIVDKPGLKFLNSRKLETSCSLSFYLTWLILSLKTWKQNADTSIDVTRDEWFKHLRTEWTDDELLTPCINSNNASVNQGSIKNTDYYLTAWKTFSANRKHWNVYDLFFISTVRSRRTFIVWMHHWIFPQVLIGFHK